MNILVKLAFDGTNYHGTQIQENANTVFRVFQEALIGFLGHKTDIKGCSRLDSGVHAKSFYLSFKTDKDINIAKLPLALNVRLPEDIKVMSAQVVPDDFHARYSSKGKEYTYYIWNSHIDDPFNSKYYYRYPKKLDAEKMNIAAGYFVGQHDFRSFMRSNSKIIDCRRQVYSAKVERRGDMVKFIVSADGYLYNMVRIMAGTLIKIGGTAARPELVKDIITAENRAAAGVTAPAKGLFLTDVFYDFNEL